MRRLPAEEGVDERAREAVADELVPQEVDAANEDDEGHVAKVDGERVDLRWMGWVDGRMDRWMDG